MPFKSQEYKYDIYPSTFTEDDKLLFDRLFEESKIYHKKEYEKEPWLITYAVICYINGINGRCEDIKQEEIEELRKVYQLKSRVFETPESYDYKDPEKFIINLPDDELKEKLNILTSNDLLETEPALLKSQEENKGIFDNSLNIFNRIY